MEQKAEMADEAAFGFPATLELFFTEKISQLKTQSVPHPALFARKIIKELSNPHNDKISKTHLSQNKNIVTNKLYNSSPIENQLN